MVTSEQTARGRERKGPLPVCPCLYISLPAMSLPAYITRLLFTTFPRIVLNA
ncbi:hypothetical protein I79_015801 [Cricetulus griseus]|uniref:Uncharacterized protein n=1 Tax=Cricetulus griseus TaxID=10029 RepID=G3HXN8_CRIGR|nr:hypothetical protein I79_015801 [Cricetulus griseus]